MVNLNLSTVVLLPALAAAGVMTTMVFSFNNNMFPRITEIIEDPAATTLPGTDVPLTREWTGVGRIDRQLTVLLIFFWQLLDGRYPQATLQGVHFFGQMGAFWTLMQLEAKREGNKSRIIAYTTIFGLIYQNISVAITIPIWALLSLLTNPSSTPSSLPHRLSISPTEARLLPWSMFLGYILPSIAMAIPSPSLLPSTTQQTLITLWQVFPLWVTLSTALLRPFFRTPTTTTTTNPHLFALLLAALPHATTLSLSLTTLLLPSLFAPDTAAALHPAAVFLPKASAPGTDPGLAEAALRFMQWDEAVSTAATVVWAATVSVGIGAYNGIEEYFLLDMMRFIKPDVEISIYP
ncbi:hypothetical protein GTA08_BOTSDO00033 [Neofusicoccum parvum]|uniref:Uncharacterized protein n=1 Tax=Neofusicoccum parvum TaxID=310453 RepID=A0ACB5SJ24_9PEZI|nr:hypothetical protein GTA08_BOTSDO00033 [Neofusicoccum parvum]